MNLKFKKKEKKSLRGVFSKYSKNSKEEMKIIKEVIIKKYKRNLDD